MADRYELLADLPFIKKGTIYFKDTIGEYVLGDRTSYIPDVIGMKHSRFAIHSDYVENNSIWFQKIEEKPTKEQIEQAKELLMKEGYVIGLAEDGTFRIFFDMSKSYTESDLRQARIDAFNIARETSKIQNDYPYSIYKYRTPEDYLQSLNTNNKEKAG